MITTRVLVLIRTPGRARILNQTPTLILTQRPILEQDLSLAQAPIRTLTLMPVLALQEKVNLA